MHDELKPHNFSAADNGLFSSLYARQSRSLQSRVIRSSGRAPVVAPCVSARPQTHHNYSTESMLKAYEAVQRGEISI